LAVLFSANFRLYSSNGFFACWGEKKLLAVDAAVLVVEGAGLAAFVEEAQVRFW
jgi:hypothetical protein